MARFLSWFERWFLWIIAAVLLALAILAVAIILSALPPREFTILTGREGAGYYRAAQAYKQYAAGRGYVLNIQSTSGSLETLELLESGEGSIGFVQGGVTVGADPEVLSTLAGVFYEPVWIFYQRDFQGGRELVHLYELEGGRINLGEPGSGASHLARQLLAANGVNAGNSTFLELPADDAAAELREGRLDAAVFVVSANSDTVRTLARVPDLDLMDVQRADAYRDRFPYLTTLVLPEGAIDVREGLPDEDKRLIGTAANLIVRNDFHPELIRLITDAAVETHENGGLFEQRFEFPNYEHADLPIDREERGYLERVKNGVPTALDQLPYWVTALADRYLLFLVPLAALALLLVTRRAVLFGLYGRRKLSRWYDLLRRMDLRAAGMDAAEVDECLEVLDGIEQEVLAEGILSEGRRAEFNDLRGQIDLVEERLRRRRNELTTD